MSSTRLSQYVIELLAGTENPTDVFQYTYDKSLMSVKGKPAADLYSLMEKAGFKKFSYTTGSTVSGEMVSCLKSKITSVGTRCEIKGLEFVN